MDFVEEDGEIIEGEWRNEGQSPYLSDFDPMPPRKAEYEAEYIRDHFKEYFQSVGAVSWQYKHIYTN